MRYVMSNTCGSGADVFVGHGVCRGCLRDWVATEFRIPHQEVDHGCTLEVEYTAYGVGEEFATLMRQPSLAHEPSKKRSEAFWDHFARSSYVSNFE
jgi:hypothetical protein